MENRNHGSPTIRIKFMMMMSNLSFFANIEDDYVRSLPVMSFPGVISVIDQPSHFEFARQHLTHEPVLGFDTETKPSFKKGHYHSVALLQLSTADHAFLFRLNKIQLPEFIADILEDKDVVKVGVAIKDDIAAINKIFPFEPDGFIDLQQYVKPYGIVDNGLKKLVANVLGFRITKKSQTSNWEHDQLTQEQIDYAATDAWVCRQIYQILKNQPYPPVSL